MNASLFRRPSGAVLVVIEARLICICEIVCIIERERGGVPGGVSSAHSRTLVMSIDRMFSPPVAPEAYSSDARPSPRSLLFPYTL